MPVYGCGAERAFMQYPVLEPAYLFRGFPPAELRNKFLMAKPCAVRDVDDSGVPPELADRVLGLCGGVCGVWSADGFHSVCAGGEYGAVVSCISAREGGGGCGVCGEPDVVEGCGLCGEVNRKKES